MKEPHSISKNELFSSLPPVWPNETLRLEINQHIKKSNRCIVVLDDDPTGTQTVHDVWVLTQWQVEDLLNALHDDEPVLYILTNSRAMPLKEAQNISREIAFNLIKAGEKANRPITVVSRSDSTLRGHYPGEVDALIDVLSELQHRPFDGVCIIPSFPDSGRFTIGDIHWVQEGSLLIPVGQTAYAKDDVFGYHSSNLREWIQEKTKGAIPAKDVMSISIDLLRIGGPREVAKQLIQAKAGRVIVVNAAHDRDLDVFVSALQSLEAEGKRFLFRTAASFIKVAAGLIDHPLLKPNDLVGKRPPGGGLIVFGSHVPKSTTQLAFVQELESIEAAELYVPDVLNQVTYKDIIIRVSNILNSALASGRNALVYTSRDLITRESHNENIKISQSVSSALTEVVRRLKYEPRYVIGKGGITSSDLATDGMDVRAARVLGQILPGVPVWRLEHQSRWPGMPYIVFPGNVGEESSVADIVKLLS